MAHGEGITGLRRVIPAATRRPFRQIEPAGPVGVVRLRARNLNAPADIARRLRNAAIEVQLYDRFEYVVLNEDLDRALAHLEAIIIAERCRPDRQRNRIESVIDTFGGESFHA